MYSVYKEFAQSVVFDTDVGLTITAAPNVVSHGNPPMRTPPSPAQLARLLPQQAEMPPKPGAKILNIDVHHHHDEQEQHHHRTDINQHQRNGQEFCFNNIQITWMPEKCQD